VAQPMTLEEIDSCDGFAQVPTSGDRCVDSDLPDLVWPRKDIGSEKTAFGKDCFQDRYVGTEIQPHDEDASSSQTMSVCDAGEMFSGMSLANASRHVFHEGVPKPSVVFKKGVPMLRNVHQMTRERPKSKINSLQTLTATRNMPFPAAHLRRKKRTNRLRRHNAAPV